MGKVRFSDSSKSTILEQSVTNGKFYVASDTHELYCDTLDGERIKISDIEYLETNDEREGILAPLNKFYYVSDTNKLWYYNERWVQIGPGSQLIIQANGTQLGSYTGEESVTVNITKTNIGLGNVPNVATNDQTPTFTSSSTLTALVSGEKLSVAFGKIAKAISDLISHLANKSNPHGVTKTQISLGNVTNDRQIKGLASGTTSGHVVEFGADGYTVQDSGFTIGKSVPSNAVFTDTTYTVATQSKDGLFSSEDKTKLDGIAKNANNYTHPSYTNRSSGLYKIVVDATGHVSAVTAVSKSDITALGIPASDTNTWTAFKGASSSAAGTAGYVPAPSAGASNRYFRSDGTWAVPPDTNTTYTVFKGATASAAGGTGLVPAPASGYNTRFLRGDGTWQLLSLSILGVTATAAELNKLDGATVTVTEINYLDGVTSNIQTQLNGKASTNHGTHVTYGTSAPLAPGTASAGSASTVSRSDHRHPLQTTVSGNAGSATKLQTARTINGVSFDGSKNITIGVDDGVIS